MTEQTHPERGAVLLGVLMIVLILTLLGMVSMNLAVQEILQISANKDEAAARHVAEAGSDVVIRWFHNVNSMPIGASTVLSKRFDLPGDGPSFFDASGRSQFSGTSAVPDLLYDAARPGDDHLLNDPVDGWFRSLQSLGRIQTLKVYGPTRPGLLCSVEITANAKHHTRTVALQLGALVTPPLRAGVQVGNSGVALTSDVSLPVWVHWGDLNARGNVNLGRRGRCPGEDQLIAGDWAVVCGHGEPGRSLGHDLDRRGCPLHSLIGRINYAVQRVSTSGPVPRPSSRRVAI